MKNTDEMILLLLQDDRLTRWILSPDDETIAYWEKWMADHPDQVQTLLKAREIARDLAYADKPAGLEELQQSIWPGISEALDAPVKITHHKTFIPKKVSLHWLAAASFLGIFLAAGITYYSTRSKTASDEGRVVNVLLKEDLDRVNQTDHNQIVYLVDGSQVILQPGAGIRHSAFLQKDKREIYLEGNAFFQVAGNPQRPFFVYAGDLVVRVLGTSFKVSANKSNGEITVLVKSGKVAVSRRNGASGQQLILASNQGAVYKGQTLDLMGSSADRRTKLADEVPVAAPVNFDFEEAPLEEIIQTLEKAYGIPFYYDKNTFSRCMLTTNLTDETLEEKLKIICEAIGATYQIKGNGVFLDGKPCK